MSTGGDGGEVGAGSGGRRANSPDTSPPFSPFSIVDLCFGPVGLTAASDWR